MQWLKSTNEVFKIMFEKTLPVQSNKIAEMPTTTEYINQYFKMKIFNFLNRRVLGNILTSILN